MAKLEYLLLAYNYSPAKHNICNWYVSEKLDGARAFWDGGISRGKLCTDVPYANTIKDTKPVVATGLWSRTGKVIHAPGYWLNQLPDCLLDGELYLGRGFFQELRKITAQHVPDVRWRDVEYKIFDSPSWSRFTKVREITIRSEYSFWVKPSPQRNCNKDWPYDLVLMFLEKKLKGSGVASIIPQEQLRMFSVAHLDDKLKEIVKKGGEGVMLRKPSFRWDCIRSHCLLKHKPTLFGDGILRGFTAGKGRLLGKIGALILDYNGKKLELSGLTDDEREFSDQIRRWAEKNPGRDMLAVQTCHFQIGDTIQFKYRELSDDGVPKEARFLRK